MGVSKNRGTPEWMVKIMENPVKMDDLGVPPFKETSIYVCFKISKTTQTSKSLKSILPKNAYIFVFTWTPTSAFQACAEITT